MSQALERILEEVKGLTLQERQRLREFLEQETPSRNVTARNRVRQTRGKYAHVPTSSGAFARRKREEIELEDNRTAQ